MDGCCTSIVELACNDSVTLIPYEYSENKGNWPMPTSVDLMFLSYVKTEKCAFIAYTCEAQWLSQKMICANLCFSISVICYNWEKNSKSVDLSTVHARILPL